MNPVLVDSSVWIDFFREADSPVKQVVSLLLEKGQARICWTIQAELLSGPSADKEAGIAWLLQTVPCLEVQKDDFLHAAELRRMLQRRGLQTSLPDLLITAVAMRHHAEIYTLDKLFSKIPELKLYEA